MGVKIINILKDDTFNDILELFRQAPSGEVILVLPRVGKLFKREDHFAAFAAEAEQGKKTVSILTANPQIAQQARGYGFGVMAANPAKSRPKKTKVRKAEPEPVAVPFTSPPPADEDTPSDDDNTPKSDVDNDVPLTADETTGETPEEEKEDQFIQAEETAELTASHDVKRELDYIEAMWREKAGRKPAPATISRVRAVPSFLARTTTTKKIAVGILGATIIVLGGVVYLMTGSAHVALTPVNTPLEAQIAVQVSDTFTAIDDTFSKIPGQALDVSKTASNTVKATGQRDVASKARGIMTVYNEYSSTPQTLVATTRFKSSDGKIFRTLQSITVPGNGTKTVEVIAEKPGTDYNIPAGQFTIAAFQEKGDTEKAAKFYGKTTQAMSGGASGPSPVVTQADYDQAKDAAIAEVKDQIKTALATQGDGLTILNADNPDVSNIQSTARPDDSAESVTVTVTGTLKTIAFRKSDLQELVRSSILKKDRLVVLPDTLNLAYTDVAYRADLGTLNFNVSVEGTAYAPVDMAAIKGDIAGKNQQEIRDYFKDREGILSATVSLSPFWVRSVPDNQERTTIDIQYGR